MPFAALDFRPASVELAGTALELHNDHGSFRNSCYIISAAELTAAAATMAARISGMGVGCGPQ